MRSLDTLARVGDSRSLSVLHWRKSIDFERGRQHCQQQAGNQSSKSSIPHYPFEVRYRLFLSIVMSISSNRRVETEFVVSRKDGTWCSDLRNLGGSELPSEIYGAQSARNTQSRVIITQDSVPDERSTKCAQNPCDSDSWPLIPSARDSSPTIYTSLVRKAFCKEYGIRRHLRDFLRVLKMWDNFSVQRITRLQKKTTIDDNNRFPASNTFATQSTYCAPKIYQCKTNGYFR